MMHESAFEAKRFLFCFTADVSGFGSTTVVAFVYARVQLLRSNTLGTVGHGCHVDMSYLTFGSRRGMKPFPWSNDDGENAHLPSSVAGKWRTVHGDRGDYSRGALRAMILCYGELRDCDETLPTRKCTLAGREGDGSAIPFGASAIAPLEIGGVLFFCLRVVLFGVMAML